MTTQNRDVVLGVFNDPADAQRAVADLKAAGFNDDQIGVALRDSRTGVSSTSTPGQEDIGGEMSSRTATGAAAGAATGAGLGGLWALGIAAGVLPAIGPVIAGGVLASILASAAAGAVAGGLFGALVGLGIPEEEAQYYDEQFRSGRTIVTVRSSNRSSEAASILRRNGAYDASSQAVAGRH